MNRKYLFAGLVSFAALPCFGEVPMEISLLMKDGEFAKADSVIGKSGVSLTAVEADSLRAIMSRIEMDFCYTGSLTVRGEIFFENNWLTIW